MDCCLKNDKDLCILYNPKIFDLMVKKYTLTILTILDKYGTMRFSEIRRKIEGMTQRSLSLRLKEMEDASLVKRELHGEKPLKVTYSLTTEGKALKNAMLMILQLTLLVSPDNRDYFC
ncbi:HxlR family transcriptional regulator [Candidatus Acidianus copahuensis]|uniref:HxlR family transcriptional regulator n=1 Tax=Candidatus Acidianus copahuensis TaxID=1160895 RepID=A0A031LKG1_9CREN|nr:helix-turn-helix domain-containing protein [Candidatus Acidianus copahuensis]EZQ01975.1 HxlR family transcriptional regulator [Candidatus Acidianus copahuensis]